MNICVGNISRTATEQDLKDAFAASAAAAAGTDRLTTLFERQRADPREGLSPFLFSGGFPL
jgi:hypothetical protein